MKINLALPLALAVALMIPASPATVAQQPNTPLDAALGVEGSDPNSATAPNKSSPTLTVIIEADGKVYFSGGDPKLEIQLQNVDTRRIGNRHVQIKAAPGTPASKVREVVDALQKAGASALMLVSEPTDAATESVELKIFQLVNSRASDIVRLVEQLYSKDKATLVADTRTNSIVARGPAQALLEIEALLLRLDTTVSVPDGGTVLLGGIGPEMMPNRRHQGSDSAPNPLSGKDFDPFGGSSAVNARDAYQRQERQAVQLAAEYQKLQSSQATGRREELKNRLRREVQAAFEARQQLQRAELVQLRQRLAGIEQSIAARERVKDKIVENRVAELLDPNLQWEPAESAVAPAPADRYADYHASREQQASPISARDPRIDPAVEAHPEVRFKHAALRVAEADYAQAAAANKKAPGSVTQSELRRLALMVEKARLELELVTRGDEVPSSLNRPSARSVDPTAEPGRWPSAMPGGSLILRSAEEYGRELGAAEAKLQHSSRLSSRGFVSPATLAADERRLKALQAEYSAQLRLLELELQTAQLTLETASVELRRAQQLHKGGNVDASEVERLSLKAKHAQVRLEQLKTLHDLYRKAGQTDSDAKDKPSEPPADDTEPPAKEPLSAKGAGHAIEWLRDLEAAKRAAAANNRLVLIDVGAPWCHWCEPLEENVFGRPEVIRAIEDHYVPVRLDYDLHRATVRQYEVKGVPWVVILRPDGDLVDQFNTPQTAEKYLDRVNRVAASSTPLPRK